MASSLNRVILIGRLTREPEMRFTASGAAVANFTLAVDRPFLNAQGQREADFIRVVAWRKLAENCSNYLGKGRLVAVEGRLQVRSYQTPDGQTRTVSEVVADNVQFLDRAREGTAPVPGVEPPEADLGYPGGDFGDEDFGSEEPPF
ncbi:MAG TPA: single-stranded DNA-binding protein [Syntrophomonadaceae bacterium]|nr:single-stranded DNA-binding protein [Syntrophomonadaceae bacterium]